MSRTSLTTPPNEGPALSTTPAGPILLTGAHRSGTTWAGRALSAAPGVAMIYEPMNYRWRRPGVCPIDWPQSYFYIPPDGGDEYVAPLARMLRFQYSYGAELRSIRGPRDVARLARDAARFELHRARGARPLVKDPNALFSAPWFASRLGVTPVVLIRHPAAFANSIRRRNWEFPFDRFSAQSRLVGDLLQPYRDRLEAFATSPRPIASQAGLIWSVIYSVVRRYQAEHPGWIFVRHEDLAADPFPRFRDLFARLRLEWTPGVEAKIREISTGRGSERPADALHWMQRDSGKVAAEWRRELTPEDLRLLREELDDVYDTFYSDADW